MAVATGGTLSIAGSASGTTRTTVFDKTAEGGAVRCFGVSNNADSTGKCFVIVGGLHTEAMPLAPGVSWPYTKVSGISEVVIYGDGSNAATVDFGVLIR